MTKSAQTLHSNNITSCDAHTPHTVEHCDACAKQWRDSCRVRVLRDPYCSLSTQGSVLAIPAIARDTVDGFVGTHLELSTRARATCVVVPAVPSATHSVSNLPLLLGLRNSHYGANELMAEALDLST